MNKRKWWADSAWAAGVSGSIEGLDRPIRSLSANVSGSRAAVERFERLCDLGDVLGPEL